MQLSIRGGFISANALKIIAAIAMLIDHIGVFFFPFSMLYRQIGRLALPIFAFMISEGAVHTRSKLRYFLHIFVLAAACQLVYFFYNGDTYMSILVTFSLGLIAVYAWDFAKRLLIATEYPVYVRLIGLLPFVAAVAMIYGFNELFTVDYGFTGCMLPWFASLLRMPKSAPEKLKRLDRTPIHALTMAAGLMLLVNDFGKIQLWALLALPLLLLYSGKRGRYKMKYFFYIFYPLHLLVLNALYMLIR